MAALIQPYQPEDPEGVLEVLARAMPADPISPARFVQQVLLDPNFQPGGALVARDEGRVVGFCLAMARQVPLENAPPDGERGYVTLIGVWPERQRQGIGSALLARTEAFLRSHGRATVMVAPYAPGYFIPGVDVAAYADALRFFLRQGYREVYRPIAMEAPLWEWRLPEWAAGKIRGLEAVGVRCEPYCPEATLPLLEFTRREFPGDWVRVVRETMGRIAGGEPAERLWIAREQERVLGFAQFQHERFGPIGVAAAERGRGVGLMLMFRTLAAMRAQGLRAAWFLWSDDATARRLYQHAGFQERRRFAVLRKELAG